MKLPVTTGLVKLNALIGCVALILFVVALATNYWLEKLFLFPVNAGGVDTIPVQANIGLFTACKIEYYPNNKSTESCSPDGAADWQVISAGLSIAGLVFGLIGVVLAVLSTIVLKVANKLKVKLAILLCYFITCDLCAGPLIMFPINRRIQVRPNQSPFQADFDLAWSFIIAAVSVVLFAFLLLLNTVEIIWSHSNDDIIKKDNRYALSKDTNHAS